MKCTGCYCLFNNGTYEYPEPSCRAFGDETPDVFYKEDGCCLHHKEAAKINDIIRELEGLQYFDLEFTDGTENEYGFPNIKKYSELNEQEKQRWDNYLKRKEQLSKEYKEYLEHLERKYGGRKK